MIYKSKFIKETSLTAIGVFVVLLAILISTQVINLLGRAANGRVAIDAVAALAGFWTLGLTPLLLILTCFISVLTVLTRYWRDSEMSVWLSCGLSLKSWIAPVLTYSLPFAILIGLMSTVLMPWAELRSQEYAEVLKKKQDMSMIQAGVFQEIGRDKRVYFVNEYDANTGVAKNLFIQEKNQDGSKSVILAKQGRVYLDDKKRMLRLEDGHRYQGIPGQANYKVATFESLELIISTTAEIVDPLSNRRFASTQTLLNSTQPELKAELMWRLSMPLSVLILSLLAIPLSYFNPRTGHTYNALFAVALFLAYQNGLTFLRDAVQAGKISFATGFFPMHLLMFFLAIILIRMRVEPSSGFWSSLRTALFGRGKK